MSDELGFFEDFAKGGLSAHILGDCEVCGEALTPAVATSTNTQTGEEVTLELLVCSKDISHTFGRTEARP